MAEQEDTKKIESPATTECVVESLKEVAEEEQTSLVLVAAVAEEPEVAEDKPETKSDVYVAEAKLEPDKEAEKKKKVQGSCTDRDAVLARVATEKKLCFIRAWEESKKSKAENKAEKKLSEIGAWENSNKATLEAELKKMEEQLEKKKADYVEKVKNQMAFIRRAAEEKRAIVEAQRGVDLLRVEEVAAKHIATGSAPKKLLFGWL